MPEKNPLFFLNDGIHLFWGLLVNVRATLILALVGTTAGCASLSREARDPAAAAGPNTIALESPSEIDKIIEETNPVLAEMNTGDGAEAPLQIPIEINRKVAQWIDFFTVRERELTQRYLERGEALRPHIEQILKENEVPKELYYLAMIESGFVSHAKSRAKAVGVWQFMKGTAKNYGLAVTGTIDERRNWVKATEAAASYLKDLNNVFGSWYLALAAYNAGEHRIVRSIMKGKTRDFWALAEAGLLPKETLNYVPKFLAAHIVGKNLKRFGFELNVAENEKWETFETYSVPAGIKLSDIARTTGVPYDVLKRWNSDLVRGITPFSKTGTFEIYLPKSQVAKLEEKKEALAKLRRYKTEGDQRSYASADSEGAAIYVVRRGDNLSVISRKLGVSLRTLMKINGLRRGRIHPGQRLKYYPRGASTVESRERSRSLAESEKGTVHVVRRGENLSRIAGKYGVSISSIMRANGLRDADIRPGQRLRVGNVVAGYSVHVVRPGENLTHIAQKRGVTLSHLMRANRLKSAHIQPGQRLKYRADSFALEPTRNDSRN